MADDYLGKGEDISNNTEGYFVMETQDDGIRYAGKIKCVLCFLYRERGRIREVLIKTTTK